MSRMTDERRWDIHKQLHRFGMRCGYTDDDVIRECLEEIDRLSGEIESAFSLSKRHSVRNQHLEEENRKLKLEVDTLTQQEESWRELLERAQYMLICDSDYQGDEMSELSVEIMEYRSK